MTLVSVGCCQCLRIEYSLDPSALVFRQASKGGPPDTDALHALIMTGFQDVWKKFQSNLWVALPQHWIQGWVSATIQAMINDLGSGNVMTEKTALALKQAIFLPPEAAIQDDDPDSADKLVPTKDNAFLG